VALGEEGFLDAGLYAFPEEGAVGQHKSGAAAGFENLHQEYEEEGGGFAGAELGGEIGLDAVLLHAAEGRVCDNDIHALPRPPVTQRAGECVVVADVGGHINSVQ
jgi:hypothetical protein